MTTASNNNSANRPPSTLGRLAAALTSRHWSTFVIELALIVAGIFVALSIDDWVQERAEQRSERIYLASLIRDLDQMAEALQGYVDTERAMASASATTLKILTAEGYEQQSEEQSGRLLQGISWAGYRVPDRRRLCAARRRRILE